MIRVKQVWTGVFALTAVVLSTGNLPAQVLESNWNASLTGSQSWQVDANWSTPTYPNDPDRMDLDMTTFDDVIGANLSVGLGANLNLNVGATDVTVAALRLGGTAGAVTTEVSATGGRLVFQNNELNDNTDPDNVICSYNCSEPLIISGGVPGSTNIISAPIFARGAVTLGSDDVNQTTNDLTLSGTITFPMTTGAPTSINNASTNELLITGNLSVIDVNPDNGTSNPPDAGLNTLNAQGGTVRVTGTISGDGRLNIGLAEQDASEITPADVWLSSANTISGTISQGRTNLILDHDMALGTARLRQGNGTENYGANVFSTDDNRTIANNMELSQDFVVMGEHSLTWNGEIQQTNARSIINLLPSGKTLTMGGTIFIDADGTPDSTAIPTGDKEMFFDGSGKTIVKGPIVNVEDPVAFPNIKRSLGIAGATAVYLQGSIQGTPAVNNYAGFTHVRGGNLHFATLADMGNSTEFRSRAGAVGLDTGTFTTPTSSNTFLSRFNNRTSASAIDPTHGDFVTNDAFDTGGLMLTPGESATNLNFTTGALVNTNEMSIAAPEDGLSYTGTVTPANSTYRFGGGAGVITLPGTNQLTGANNFVATNGLDDGNWEGLGGVRITGTNNYTGVTRIQGKYLATDTRNALANESVGATAYNGTTLTVTNLANGGVNSSIGSSSNAASNVVIQGSTLRYEGDGDSTDRLFTIGTHGATLDSSGSGAVDFSNTGALGIGTASSRTGVASGLGFGRQTAVTESSTVVAFKLPDTSDLVIGMEFSESSGVIVDGPDEDTVVTITGIQSASRFQFSDQIPVFSNVGLTPSTFNFIDVERTFELTGDNTGDNTLSPAIGDSPTNVVNVLKSGVGKWILDGANTYTGNTTIEEGVLGVRSGVGDLDAGANLDLMAGGVLEIEIDGVGSNDHLTITGDALLAGVIDVSLLGGFTPSDGATFDILTAATIDDTGLTLSGASDFTHSIVDGTTLRLTFSGGSMGLPGDFNGDGKVDILDLDILSGNFGTSGGATLAQGDANGDGNVDILDLDILSGNFGSMASASAAIPEPATALLALVGLAGLVGNGRRR